MSATVLDERGGGVVVWIELAAVRVAADEDIEDAIARAEDLEGVAVDDARWDAMVALASTVIADLGPLRVEEDRRWGSVKASTGPLLIDVLFDGQMANVYFTAQGDAGLDDLEALLGRLRASGFTVVEPSGRAVEPGDDLLTLDGA